MNLGIKSPLLCQLSYAGRVLILHHGTGVISANGRTTRVQGGGRSSPFHPQSLSFAGPVGCRRQKSDQAQQIAFAPHRSEDPAPNFCPSNRGGMAEEPPELWLPTGDPSKPILFLEP